MRARTAAISIVTMGLAAILAGALPAAAGGCGEPASHGTGTTVEIVHACFLPSLLSIEPGATVTFVNRDAFEHNVGGQAWGHFDALFQHQRFQATFRNEGIYPFACTIHPGMTGAIVVGDGSGPGNGHAVSVGPVQMERADPSPSPDVASAGSDGSRDGSHVVPVAGATLIAGLVVGFALAAYRERWTAGRLTIRSAHP